MSNHAMPRKGWKRAARGTMLGTAAAGVLLLSGSTPTVAVPLPDRAVAKAADPGGGGYWLTDSDGEVYAFGSVSYYGSLTNMHLNSPVVGIASAPDGKGYWLVARDGGVFPFGSAKLYGSLPALNIHEDNVVGIATPLGPGVAGPTGPAGPPGPTGPTGPGREREWVCGAYRSHGADRRYRPDRRGGGGDGVRGAYGAGANRGYGAHRG